MIDSYRVSGIPVQPLFEDNHLLVLHKPAGIPVQAGRLAGTSLLEDAKAYLKEKYQKPGKVWLGLVHRLDLPVEGIVVFARTSKSAARLSDQIRRKTWKKSYLGILNSPAPIEEGRWIDWLEKRHQTAVESSPARGKEAVLEMGVVQKAPPLYLCQFQLETGRFHQIRFQCGKRGAPLLGDVRYGGEKVLGGLHLVGNKLVIQHPVQQEELTFEIPSPTHWPLRNGATC